MSSECHVQTQNLAQILSVAGDKIKLNLLEFGRLDNNQLCGRYYQASLASLVGTYTSEGIDKICEALRVNSTLQFIRYRCFEPQNLAQQVALDHICRAYKRVPPPPEGLDAKRAHQELCGASILYQPGVCAKTAPYSKDLVSWPDIGSVAAAVEDNLDAGTLD